jgi:hypothetical protein
VRTNMQEWTEIRRKVLVEGAPKRQVMRDYRISHETLQKMLSNPEPPGYRQSVARCKHWPKRRTLTGRIGETLASRAPVPTGHP